MKKTLIVLLIALKLLLLLTGCAETPDEISLPSFPPPVIDLPPLPSEHANTGSPPETEEPSARTEENKGDPNVDLDLTVLSSTMVFGQVFSLMLEPEDYLGKTLKVQGEYYSEYYEPAQQRYHFIIITDATLCCSQGIEFIYLGNHTYPDDYPENHTEIEITGVFTGYEEEGHPYYRLETDTIKVVNG